MSSMPLPLLSFLVSACPLVAVVGRCQEQASAPPARVEAVSVHDRPGGFEASVVGRAVETDGDPAAGALVTLYERYPGWSGGWRILGQQFADAEGHFAFHDAEFSDAAQVIDIRGGADFAIRGTPVSLVTGGHMDVGDVKLEPYFVLEGRFDGPLPGTRNWFQLLDPVRGSVARGVQLSEDRTFRLTDIRPGDYRVRVFSESRVERKTERVNYDALWSLSADVPRQRLLLDADGTTLLIRRDESNEPVAGRVGAGRSPLGQAQAAPSERLAGRIVDEKDRPLPGLTVGAYSAYGQNVRVEPGARAVTDADGRFELEYAGFEAARLWIASAHGSLGIEFKPIDESRNRYGPTRIHVEPGTDMQIVAPATRLLDLPEELPADASGSTTPLEYSIRRGGFWEAVPHETAEIGFDRKPGSLLVNAQGYLPRVVTSPKALKASISDWSQEVARRLEVTGSGAPLEDARVYLRQLNRESPHATPWVVGELLRDARSEFGGRAPQDLVFEAVVIAPGHAPGVVMWGDAPVTRVALEPCGTRVSFEGVRPGEGWAIGDAGRGMPLAAWFDRTADRESPYERQLSPGHYDGLLFGRDGSIIAAQTFEVTGGEAAQEIDVRADLRVHAVLHLPLPPVRRRMDATSESFFEPEAEAEPDAATRSSWSVWVTRGSEQGGTAGAAATTTMGGAPSIEWPTADVEIIDERTRRLVFHGSGLYSIHVVDDAGVLDATLFREVSVPTSPPAVAMEFRLPELTGVLLGSTKDFDADQGFSHHGVAGPRYLLRAATPLDEDLGWSAIGFVPPRVGADEEGQGGPNFRVANLPPGDYLFEDHLYVSGWGQKGLIGGWRITLGDGAPTEIGDVATSEPEDVELLVLDARGAPVTGGTVTARDPMADAWAAFKRQPSTATMAEYPIAAPFSARLDANGQCTIPRLRRDAVVLELTLDRGVRISALVPIVRKPKSRAIWVLPDTK